MVVDASGSYEAFTVMSISLVWPSARWLGCRKPSKNSSKWW